MGSGNYCFNFTGIKILTILLSKGNCVFFFFFLMGLFLKQKISFPWVFLEALIYLEIRTSAHLEILILR